MNRYIPLLAGFALGSALMYAFDPGSGRRRRALARNRFARLGHTTSDRIDETARHWSNRAAGTVAEARRWIRSDRPDDDVLVERVRSALGREVSHPRAIEVGARNGTVRLSGAILSHEVNRLLRAVEAVPGVAEIDNRLEPHDQPGNVPSLQGGSENMTPAPQW